MKAELNNLVQKQVSVALKQFKPQQVTDKTNESSNQNKRKTTTTNKSTTNKPKQQIPKQTWKASPPLVRMTETTQVDGKTWHWCAHCGFWHLSHGTAGHKYPSMLPPQTKN